MPFHVHVDPDLLAQADLAAVAPVAGVTTATGATEEHHGASDIRLPARQRSERARAKSAEGAGKSRAYAFRRH